MPCNSFAAKCEIVHRMNFLCRLLQLLFVCVVVAASAFSSGPTSTSLPDAKIDFPPDFEFPDEIKLRHSMSHEAMSAADVGVDKLPGITIEEDMVILNNKSSSGRAAMSASFTRWPKTGEYYVIPYLMSDVTSAHHQNIRWCAEYLFQNSNIKMIERTNELDFFRFVNQEGCWSYIGLVNRNWLINNLGRDGQPISLGQGCNTRHVILHEIGHALGLMHEQDRVDASQHLQNAPNTGQGVIAVTEYEVYSVMHYITFRSNNPEIDANRGRRSVFTLCDLHAINVIYPGTVKPPRCIPNQLDDFFTPSPAFLTLGVDFANWMCRHNNEGYLESGQCLFRAGEFPPSLRNSISYDGRTKGSFLLVLYILFF